MEAEKSFIIGIYDDEDVVIRAVGQIRKSGIGIHEVYTPYPVHGLGHALGYKRSRLPIAAFVFGLVGLSLALLMQIWMMGYDWPMIIGGKDYVALPSFIPATFEMTVLFAALGMVGIFMIISDLKPHKKPRIFDIRSTDDKMVVAIDLYMNKKSQEEIRSTLEETGALEVFRKEFI